MLHEIWLAHLQRLRQAGAPVGPRGQMTHELLNYEMNIDSTQNLLDIPGRRLNYRFAVAEWIWMMFGRSDVESLAQFNSIMRNFSDDGVWLTGAYGPHICAQRNRVMHKLQEDPNTRQAVIEIPRPNGPTKDEPCTLSLQFLLRPYLARVPALHMIVTMRSSDAWLGIPYDVFTFTQIQNCFAGALGVPRGWMSLRAGSAHLYERDFPLADQVLHCTDDAGIETTLASPALPGFPPAWLEQVMLTGDACLLDEHSDTNPWRPYARVLLSKTSDEAREILRNL